MYLLPNVLQSRRPGYAEETVNLDMNGERYRAVRHIVSAHNSSDKEPLYISAANGLYEDPYIWRPLARRLAKIAMQEAQPMVLVTYEDSVPTGASDILTFRTERLAHVIRSCRTDGKLVMGGHSRGWISTVHAASEQQGEVSKLVGFGGAGLAPRDISGLSARKIHEITAGEVASEVTHQAGIFDAWNKTLIGQRFVHNSLTYLASHHQEMYREAGQILSADVVDRTVELSGQIPTALWVHDHDAFFDASTIRDNLARGGYQGVRRDVPTSHLGPLMDLSLVQDLYTDLVG